MEIRDIKEWDEALNKTFEDLNYLLDESAVSLYYEYDHYGPKQDWTMFILKLEGQDSGEAQSVVNWTDNMYYDIDAQEFMLMLADYIAEPAGGEVEELDESVLIHFR